MSWFDDFGDNGGGDPFNFGGDNTVPDPGFTGGYDDPSQQYPPGYFDTQPAPDGHWGMGDRGLGENGDSGQYGTLTPSEIAQLGGGGGPGIGDALSKFAKMFGMTNKDGSVNLSSLIPLLATGMGGFLSYNATKKASQQQQDAINNSNKLITSTLSPISGMYKPYEDAGLSALAKMQAMPPSNIASQFGPLAGNFRSLGSGKGINLSQMSKIGG